MAVHKLADDFELSYSLLGIQAGLEDYLLAFRINQELGTRLRRIKDSRLDGLGPLPRFEFDDQEHYVRWVLVPNRIQLPAAGHDGPKNGLFQDQPLSSTRYVLEEFSKIDFILRIESEEQAAETRARKAIQGMPGIRWVGLLDTARLKTKDLIIF